MGAYVENETPSFADFSKAKWKELGISQPNNGYAFKQYSTQEMTDKFFGGKPAIKSGNYEVYTDETDPHLGEKETILEEVTIYKSFDAVFGDIKIKLFASKDGVFLLQRYREMTEPDDKTIILFLEIDEGYNLHTVMRIRAGKEITDSEKLPFTSILKLTREHSITVSPNDLKKLLEKGAIANKKTFWTWLLKIIKAPISDVYSFFSSKLYNGAADFFENTIAKNIQSIKVSENGWNPHPKEGEFAPALIPENVWKMIKPYYEHKAIDDANLNFLGGEKTVNGVFNSFFEMLDSHKDKVTAILKSMKPYLPASIYKMFLNAARSFLGGISDLKKMLRESIPKLQSIIYKSFTVANAMLCGIYNSLVDIIAGIFSIIGFIFKFLAIQEEFKDDPSLMADFFLEYMEGIFEGIMKFDVVDFFFEMISFQAKTVSNLYRRITEKAPDITAEQVFYYYGYIVGIVIDIVVETLLTGGVAAVIKLFEGIATFMRNPLEKLAQGIAKSAKFGGDLLSAVLEFMRLMVKKFKEGSKALFEELKLWMDEIFGVGKKVEDFTLTDKQRKIKELREEKARKIQEKLDRRKNGGKYNLENVDVLGSKPATPEELAEWEKKIKILAFKEKGRFRLATKNTPALRYMEKNKVAAYFDAHEIPPVIWYKEGSSNYVIAHEYYHMEEFCKIGKKDFIKGDLGTLQEFHVNNILREKYVAERLLENAEKLNLSQNELRHIKSYYQREIIKKAVDEGVEILPEFIIRFKNYGL